MCAKKVVIGMSGGVDSSVAAALLLEQGHEVVGVTMRLWGGDSDTGCCSVSDVDDARRVAQQLGIDHLVFNFTEDFHRHVVDPYIKDLQSEVIDVFQKAAMAVKACENCGAHTAPLRKDQYTKLFQKPMPKRLRANMASKRMKTKVSFQAILANMS